VMQAFRFELDPSNRTRSKLSSHCGASRFAYNWGLALVKSRLAERDRIREAALTEGLSQREADALAATVPVSWTLYDLRREWNEVKDRVAPWWHQNSKEAANSGLLALSSALRAWSDSKTGRRKGRRIGFPVFKRRHGRRSCRFGTGALGVVDARHVVLPRIGFVRTKESTGALQDLIDDGSARILSATVSEVAGRWYVSFGCEVHRRVGSPTHPDHVVGVDVGVKALAVISTGEVVENPKPLSLAAKRIARHQRRLARQQTGGRAEPASRRSRVTRQKITRTHARVANLRADALHKVTTRMAKTYGTIVVEDLNVAGMTARPSPRPDPDRPGHHLRNGARAKAGLNRAILDASPGELRRQLAYKCEWYGSHLVVADPWFPSSKTCSSCRTVKTKLSLAERMFHCEACGLVIDRDLNASLNLAALVDHVAASGAETQNGRRGERSQAGATSRCSPMKRQAGTGSEGQGRTGTVALQRTTVQIGIDRWSLI
jgi:putative transposase